MCNTSRAYDILHDILLFGARDIETIEAHQLYDDLDAERRFFTDDEAKNKKQLNRKSINAYEAKVQEFLEAFATLVQISPMPPPTASELLLTTNSSEQTIWDDDVPCFIPADIAELILTFIAMVQPMRLVFRRTTESGATALSPYFFSNMDGTEWQAETLSRCLSQACTRAKMPEFQETWWQQAAACIIIVKTGDGGDRHGTTPRPPDVGELEGSSKHRSPAG
ncbi:hypothetical protein E4U58_000835 [Claviceps cyperi]|nr:hypothetical protein E4U58_000835 [Claviceps cyperi]